MVRLTGTCLTVNATAGVLDGGSEAATPGSFVGLTDTRCSTVATARPRVAETGRRVCGRCNRVIAVLPLWANARSVRSPTTMRPPTRWDGTGNLPSRHHR